MINNNIFLYITAIIIYCIWLLDVLFRDSYCKLHTSYILRPINDFFFLILPEVETYFQNSYYFYIYYLIFEPEHHPHVITILQTMTPSKFLILFLFSLHCVYAQQLECAGDIETIGDGKCNNVNNNEECQYDGGDCCMCTCVQGVEDCSSNYFNCLNPDDQDELYSCDVAPLDVPCSELLQQTWVIKDSADARELADTVSCSGGRFDVTWEGRISIDTPIRIVGGTVLNITGSGDSPTIDGGNSTQLFTVRGATLRLSDMVVSNGYGLTGGEIASHGSSLYLTDVHFSGNSASYGGAVSMSTGSNAFLEGSSTFSHNNATRHGGGIFMYTNSSIAWKDDLEVVGNSADVYGGGIYMAQSVLSSNGNALFSKNYAEGAAAIAVVIFSHSYFETCQFVDNVAGGFASAFLLSHESSSSFNGSTLLEGNIGTSAGSLYVQNASVSFNDDVTFKGNFLEGEGSSINNGAAMILISGSAGVFEGHTLFENNTISTIAYSTSAFGGAVSVSESMCIFNGNTTFKNNGGEIQETVLGGLFARQTLGGALNLFDSEVLFSNESSFIGNMATAGGSIAMVGSSVEWEGNALFFNNSVSGLGRDDCV